MSPKEKAEKLVEKYYVTIYYTIHQQQKGEECTFLVVNEKAKQCALIAIDEIEKSLLEYDNRNATYELQNMDRDFSYWEQVKQEIELL